MDTPNSASEPLQQWFGNAVQTTIMQAIASGNLTVDSTKKSTAMANEEVDLEATQELNLAEIDW